MPSIELHTAIELQSEIAQSKVIGFEVGEFNSLTVKISRDIATSLRPFSEIVFYDRSWRISCRKNAICGLSKISLPIIADMNSMIKGLRVEDFSNNNLFDVEILLSEEFRINFFCWESRLHSEPLVIFRDGSNICFPFRPGWGFYPCRSDIATHGAPRRKYTILKPLFRGNE